MLKSTYLVCAIAAIGISSCSPKTLFQAQDFTKENLFTQNIEGPNFDSKGQLYVVNFQKDGTIAKVMPDGSCELFLTLPQGSTANAIQFDDKGAMYLADFSGHNVLKVNMQTKEISVFSHNERFNQPNDICITRKNVLFASDPNWKQSTGQIWRIDTDGSSHLLSSDMGTTNGICLSPDEKTLYVNESIQRNIWAFDVDAQENISNKRLFTSFKDGGLDGMKCDKSGNLYVTCWGLGKILVFNSAGQQIKEVTTKGKQTSNLVFSPNQKEAFVTLQDRKGMEKFRIK